MEQFERVKTECAPWFLNSAMRDFTLQSKNIKKKNLQSVYEKLRKAANCLERRAKQTADGKYEAATGFQVKIKPLMLPFQPLSFPFNLFSMNQKSLNQTKLPLKHFSGLTRCGWVWKRFLTGQKKYDLSSTSKAPRENMIKCEPTAAQTLDGFIFIQVWTFILDCGASLPEDLHRGHWSHLLASCAGLIILLNRDDRALSRLWPWNILTLLLLQPCRSEVQMLQILHKETAKILECVEETVHLFMLPSYIKRLFRWLSKRLLWSTWRATDMPGI